MLRYLTSLIHSSAHSKSSEYARKLTFHYLSFKPYITKYVDLDYILTENLSPGYHEQDLHKIEQSDKMFQESVEDEETKSLILQSLQHEGLLSEQDLLKVINPLIPAGRIFDIPKNKRKLILDQFFLSNKNFYDHHSNIESLMIVPDLENPSEIVPVAYWVKYKDKIKAFERIREFSYYFHQETDTKEAKLLSKYKFGDYPFVRFLYEDQFNYFGLNNEESQMQGLDPEVIKRKIARFVEKIEKKFRVSKEKEFKKSFLYFGLDIEWFTSELNIYHGFNAKFEVKPNGERVVHLVYRAKNVIDPEDVEYLFGKYGEELISGNNEIEIDLEDQEKLKKLMSFGKEPVEIFELYLEDKKKLEKSKSTQDE